MRASSVKQSGSSFQKWRIVVVLLWCAGSPIAAASQEAAQLSPASQAPALAPTTSALSLFTSGDYAAAARVGLAGHEPGLLALAARALLTQAVVVGGNIEDLTAQAIGACQNALAIDPNHVEARLQWAVALSLIGARQSRLEALRSGIAQKGRGLVHEALTIDPRNPWAWALDGAWHFEVRRRGGPLGARLLGASLAKGRRSFQNAREARGAIDPVMYVQEAYALLGSDDRGDRDQARVLLEAALARAPADSLAIVMQSRAREMLGHLAKDEVGLARARFAKADPDLRP